MKTFKQAYENLIQDIIKSTDGSDLQKILYLHNFILSTVEYPNIKLIKIIGKKLILLNIFNKEKRNYFSIYGTLMNKKAFCFGIVKTIRTVLSDPRINIKCNIVKGYVNSPTKGKIIHVWNIIYLNGKPYHLDTTFDITRNPNSVKKFIGNEESPNELPSVRATKFCFERFLISDEKLKATHLWKENRYSPCEYDYSKEEISEVIGGLESKGIKFNY